jgi:hypothetical protein
MTDAIHRAMLGRPVGLVFCLAFLGSRSALAEPGARPLALELEGHAGWMQGRHDGGVALGVTSRVRYGVLTAGGSLQGATTLLSGMGSLSAVAGLSAPLGILRWDALGEAGVNAYTGVGSNFLSGDPGVSAALPFVGARSSVLVRVLRNRRGVDLWVGPSFHYASDLGSTSRTYSYHSQGSDWIFGDARDEWVTRTVHVGQARYSVLAVVSITVPL